MEGTAAADFRSLGLSPATLSAVDQAGYTVPTPVQAGLIPRALAGVDVLGQARTGTGKTASFVLPILERMAQPGRTGGPRALVLVPTRELAVQVKDEFEKLAHGSRIQCVAVYGGKPIKGQIDKLARHPAVVVGTPGRVLDHMSRGTISLSALEIVTLDEADRMLDIGFRPDIEKILRRCPDSRQTLLLSATVPPPVQKIGKQARVVITMTGKSRTSITGSTPRPRSPDANPHKPRITSWLSRLLPTTLPMARSALPR